MPTLKLTKSIIDEIPFCEKGQVLYHDIALKGLGLRVSAQTKTFFVQKAVNGRTVRTTIGQYGVFTLDQARREAIMTLGDMAKGTNPNKLKRDKKVEIITMMQAFESRVAAKSERLRPRTVSGYRGMIENHMSDWKNRSLEDITKTMIMQRFNEIAKDAGSNAATTCMRIFSVTYNYARYLNMSLPENPVIILSLTKAWHKPSRRQRVVKPHQLPAWYRAVQSEPNEIMRDYIMLLLFTGLRRSEGAGIRWKDVDFNNLTLTVHGTKNGSSHVLPLTTYTKELLMRRHKQKINGFVFPGIGIDGHMKEPKKAVKRIVDICGFDFSPHDLRRTFITTAESLDLSGYTIKYLVNHRTNNDLTGGYIVFDIDRMREPMQRIEEKLLRLIQHETKAPESKTEERGKIEPPRILREIAMVHCQ